MTGGGQRRRDDEKKQVILTEIDKRIRELADSQPERIKITRGKLAATCGMTGAQLSNISWGYWLANEYTAASYKPYSGVYIDFETWVEERNIDIDTDE